MRALGRWVRVGVCSGLLTACGYHFPGEPGGQADASWRHAVIRLENEGVWNDRLLVARLREGLRQRLGLEATAGKGPEIVLHLERRDSGVVTEGLSGLAIRRNIRLSLTPRVTGTTERWPMVSGSAYMNEVDEDPIRTASFRERAEQEAVVQLVDNLAVLLQTAVLSKSVPGSE